MTTKSNGTGEGQAIPSNEQSSEVDNVQVIEQYRMLQPKYEKLATEVEYIIQDALREEGVPIASLGKRVKSVASFADKLRRKTYSDPLSEVTDLAGTRIVSYFRGDLLRLEHMIGRLFQVHEKIDKEAEKGADKFGYMAIQFIVSLGRSCRGARYDDLHGLKCEIQTRAVLADAWAVLNHHLVYKKEAEIPSEVTRKVNALAANIELAEATFEDIRQEIAVHRARLKPKTASDFLDQPINQTTLGAYIERMFPGIQDSDKEGAAYKINKLLDPSRFQTLADINNAVQRTKNAVAALKKEQMAYGAQELEYALSFADPSVRAIYSDWFRALFAKYRDLVERSDSGHD